MTVAVTGGSGFVGSGLIRLLVAEGEDVVALVRSDAAAGVVSALGARPVRVDLANAGATAAAFAGARIVFHCAGLNSMCPRDPPALDRTNVDLAVAVVRAAAHAGVERVVHTSSAATIGEARSEIGRESSPHRGRFLSPYERSKTRGERAVLAEASRLGLDLVCVNPCSVQGPGREHGSGRLLLRIARADVVPLVRTWLSLVDVDDCARGHLLAARHGAPGERYLLCGGSLTVEDAVALLRSRTGRPSRVVWLPAPLVRGAIPFSGLAARLARGDEPPVCPAMLRTILHGHRYDGSRAERELGLRYRPVEEVLDRTLAWARERGLLPPAPRV